MGFYEVKDQTADGLVTDILSFFEQHNIDVKKCYGQSYDGANVMSGTYNGVQRKIKDLQPNAEFVHCASHNLNLVINDAVKACTEVSNYFTILQDVYTFFGNSIKRWDLLSTFTGESEVTLKKLNPTRWSSRLISITALKLRFTDIIKSLTKIELSSEIRDERMEAGRIKKNMLDFEFVFLSIMLHYLLSEVNFASKALQRETMTLDEARSALLRAKSNVENYRQCYDEVLKEAQTTALKWDIPTNFKSKRQAIKKRHLTN